MAHLCGDIERGWVGERAAAAARSGIEQVALVVDVQALDAARADLVEHRAHRGHVSLALGVRRVDDMQHEIGLGHLLERGAERRHERVRQPIDEADRVGHQQLAAIRQPHAAHERIERDEQRVGRLRRLAASAD